MAVIEIRFGPCLGAFQHSEIIDVDDERFDPRVIGRPLAELDPPGQFGYCARCGQGFHWNSGLHRWVERNYVMTMTRRTLIQGHTAAYVEQGVYPIFVPHLLPPESPEWLMS